MIIPTSDESYLARDIRPLREIAREEREYTKQKAGNSKILNLESVATAESPIFIVEEEFDLISVEEFEFTAIALSSTSMIGHLVSELQERHIKVNKYFVIALNNDKAGQTSAEKAIAITFRSIICTRKECRIKIVSRIFNNFK